MRQPLIILTATKAEAAALITYFKLAKSRQQRNYYHNETILLVVTGIGKKAALRATEQVLSVNQTAELLLNIGIAGARGGAIGALIWPRLVAKLPVNQGLSMAQTTAMQVRSSNTPAAPVEQGVLYDMEAQGIGEALMAKAGHVAFFCAKVISDNEFSTAVHRQINGQAEGQIGGQTGGQIDASGATALIRAHLLEFERVLAFLLPKNLAAQSKQNINTEAKSKPWKIT